MGCILRSELGQLLIDGFPKTSKPLTVPEVKDGGSLHLAVRAGGASQRVIVLILLCITPMGLQMKPDKSRLEVLIYSA